MKILNGFKKLVKKGVAAVKHCISAVKAFVLSCISAICGALTRVKAAVCPAAGEGYVDTECIDFQNFAIEYLFTRTDVPNSC